MALGLMGGGSLAAGLGTGYGLGVNTQPFDYGNFISVFYVNLIEDAKSDIVAYDALGGEEKKQYLEQKYKVKICQIANDTKNTFKLEGSKQRVEKDKQLCGETPFNKDKWEIHFKNYPKDLKEEWEEFIKQTYVKPTKAE